MEENITKYLRKTVLAQVDKCIDFKNEDFYKISKEQFFKGIIDPNITLKLFENNKKEEKKLNTIDKAIDETMYVILAAKVIRTIVEGSQKKDEDIEDLTGIFYVPALLNKRTSCLLPAIEDNKLPWFPRELLKPMIEPELAIGDGNEYDRVVSDGIYNIYSITKWEEYIRYCKNIYEVTTKCEFEKDEISNMNGDNEKISLESNIYIFPDRTINPTYSIKNLYSDLLKQENLPLLYENFISLKYNEERDLIKNTKENRKSHLGQMGGEYGLSASQREGVNHFNNMKYGEVLAINGPPGTGKTTLLQSIVANKFVESAIKREVPQIIVAASTNNQAVTNIIESFGKINSKLPNGLEERWIKNVNSFAVYFPSKQKMKAAKAKGFQYTNNRGEYFISNVDNEENIKASKEKFLESARKLFAEVSEEASIKNISIYKEKLHEKLCKINRQKDILIETVERINDQIKEETLKDYIDKRNDLKEELELEKEYDYKRVKFWNEKYKDVPFLWKIFSFLKKYKSKISNKLRIYVDEDEIFENNYLNLDIIEEYYAKKITSINERIIRVKEELKLINGLLEGYTSSMKSLKQCFVNTNMQEELIIDRDKLDMWLDTNVRYVSFWLAVHYYEARWLEGENELTTKQKGTNYDNVLIKLYRRLSLIAPCFVMTFYMLPKQFEALFENTRGFLYEFIDTLIVDEAGQVSTEIAASSFSLAKKALVVGDEKQISPVWGIDKPLDKSLAIQENVIKSEKEFKVLEEYGITASNSSVMRVACKCSVYSKYGERGLFLSEHRRCFDDIIQYCNELVYKGKLQPLRGNKQKKKEDILPKMGYYQIDTKASQKVGTSRINTIEAIRIAEWIAKNIQKIYDYYDNQKVSNILGVVTPFKEQAREIKRVFNSMLPPEIKEGITVGTIHTFQGGERKIIIMSTTYGEKDGCFFIDNNKSLMNVAVSRAMDSFLVFGNINCLKYEKTSPSGLLRSHIYINQVPKEI